MNRFILALVMVGAVAWLPGVANADQGSDLSNLPVTQAVYRGGDAAPAVQNVNWGYGYYGRPSYGYSYYSPRYSYYTPRYSYYSPRYSYYYPRSYSRYSYGYYPRSYGYSRYGYGYPSYRYGYGYRPGISFGIRF
jgi:hypothetical protein